MNMNFKTFALILSGIFIIGSSIGFLIGYYVHAASQTYLWMYLSAPFLGLGSGLIMYATLFTRNTD